MSHGAKGSEQTQNPNPGAPAVATDDLSAISFADARELGPELQTGTSPRLARYEEGAEVANLTQDPDRSENLPFEQLHIASAQFQETSITQGRSQAELIREAIDQVGNIPASALLQLSADLERSHRQSEQSQQQIGESLANVQRCDIDLRVSVGNALESIGQPWGAGVGFARVVVAAGSNRRQEIFQELRQSYDEEGNRFLDHCEMCIDHVAACEVEGRAFERAHVDTLEVLAMDLQTVAPLQAVQVLAITVADSGLVTDVQRVELQSNIARLDDALDQLRAVAGQGFVAELQAADLIPDAPEPAEPKLYKEDEHTGEQTGEAQDRGANLYDDEPTLSEVLEEQHAEYLMDAEEGKSARDRSKADLLLRARVQRQLEEALERALEEEAAQSRAKSKGSDGDQSGSFVLLPTLTEQIAIFKEQNAHLITASQVATPEEPMVIAA